MHMMRPKRTADVKSNADRQGYKKQCRRIDREKLFCKEPTLNPENETKIECLLLKLKQNFEAFGNNPNEIPPGELNMNNEEFSVRFELDDDYVALVRPFLLNVLNNYKEKHPACDIRFEDDKVTSCIDELFFIANVHCSIVCL